MLIIGLMNGGSDKPSVVELREVAREAGIGPVAAPAPLRLDDLRRRITETQALIARLPRFAAKAS